MKGLDLSKLSGVLARNKYVLLVLLLGLVLLLLPKGSLRQTAAPAATEPPGGKGDPLASSGIPLDTESERIAALLSAVEGVGPDPRVLLSAAGAVIVCAGAESPRVRLDVTNAVSAYTGLGSDQITILKNGAGG